MLKQLSLIKDLLSEHELLGRFYDIARPYSIFFTFVLLEIILKEKRSNEHAKVLFNAFSTEVEYLKKIDHNKLRREFFAFVNNRISRKSRKTPIFEMKIISPTIKTIKVELNKEEDVVDIIDSI